MHFDQIPTTALKASGLHFPHETFLPHFDVGLLLSGIKDDMPWGWTSFLGAANGLLPLLKSLAVFLWVLTSSEPRFWSGERPSRQQRALSFFLS